VSPSPGRVIWTEESASTAVGTALGTTVAVVLNGQGLIWRAREAVRRVLDDIDQSCSRFRSDSELVALYSAPGYWVQVSQTLGRALDEALSAARATNGAVDPCVGSAMISLGYDRDFADVSRGTTSTTAISPESKPAHESNRLASCETRSWRHIELDRERSRVHLPHGTTLDLGATAKALAADVAATVALASSGADGILVNLGGDISMAGRSPAGGWCIQMSQESSECDDRGAERVLISSGGIATSSIGTRQWRHASGYCHHIVDPLTNRPAQTDLWMATVAARTCVAANTASTAAIVRGFGFSTWLSKRALPSRLLHSNGDVSRLAGWPDRGDG